MNKYLLCLTCSVVALTSSHLAVASPLDTSHIHTQHTLGLKPISSLEDSYNLAAAVFLPDAQDGFGFASNTLDNKYETSSGNCAGFALSSCPAHAKCSKCTFDTKYKITSCDTNYKQSANACIAKTCSEINGGYKADVPTNQICNITNTSVRTCYSSCRAVNTSGYPLDNCPSGAKCTTAPECGTTSTTKGNCSPVKQKVTGCTSSTQKVNSAATACIDKDDTCPTNYYKSCATGTLGDPKYTEKGTACYQCKPACNTSIYKFNSSNCTSPKQLAGSECGGNYEKCEIPCGPQYVYNVDNCSKTLGGDSCNGYYISCAYPAKILYSDKYVSSDIINGKTPIGIVFDENKRLAVALTDITENGTAGSNTMLWKKNYCEVSTTSDPWPSGSGLSGLESHGYDGRKNTNEMLADKCGTPVYVALAVNQYQPNGCNATFCKNGQWFLPSGLDLKHINDNYGSISASLHLLQSKGATRLQNSDYWSSTEQDGYAMYAISYKLGYDSSWGASRKDSRYKYVRPVIKY